MNQKATISAALSAFVKQLRRATLKARVLSLRNMQPFSAPRRVKAPTGATVSASFSNGSTVGHTRMGGPGTT